MTNRQTTRPSGKGRVPPRPPAVEIAAAAAATSRGGAGGVETPPASGAESVYRLLPYQKRFLADAARFRIGLWARQTGKSFTSALDAVMGAIERGESWLVLSAGERQSLEWMEKAKQHARAWGLAAEIEGERLDMDIQRLTIRFPRGNRIIGLPANPDTARGYSMNVILDEFAFHERSREIWRALVPTVTRGYRLVVLSTPNGQQNMFHELWQSQSPLGWSKHKVTIEDAKAQGLDVDLVALRGVLDPDGWAQEYLCEFVDEASSLLTYDLIGACEVDYREVPGATGDTREYVGMDIGRKRDLTVIARLAALGDVRWLYPLTVLDRTPFRDQLDTLLDVLRRRQVVRACIDATGIGAMLAEEAQRVHGQYRVEAVAFTQASKEEMATGMLRAFQDRTVRLYPDRDLREDLHKIRKVTTAAGNVRYLADRDDAGHADRFWALALALHAGATAAGPFAFQPLALPLGGPVPLFGGAGRVGQHPLAGIMLSQSPFGPSTVAPAGRDIL